MNGIFTLLPPTLQHTLNTFNPQALCIDTDICLLTIPNIGAATLIIGLAAAIGGSIYIEHKKRL